MPQVAVEWKWSSKEFLEQTCIKAGLEIQGFPVGEPIPPQKPLSFSEKEEISNALMNMPQ